MSTKEDQKRARERFFFDQLQRFVPGLHFVKHGEAPAWPDIVAADDRGLLGIELTQVFCDDGDLGSPTVAEERRRTKCLEKIARCYYAGGGSPAHVLAVYLDHEGRNLNDAVRLLLKASARPGPGPHEVKVPNRSKKGESAWATLHLTKVPVEVGSYCDWTAVENSSGWVAVLQPAALRACIVEKAANLSRYRQHLSRVALLIYVERHRRSGMIELVSDNLLLDGAGFESVYLLMHLRVGGPPLLRIDADLST